MNYSSSGNKNGQIKEFNLLLPCFMCIFKRIFDVSPVVPSPFSEAPPESCHAKRFSQSTSDLISRVLCLQPMINDRRSGEMCLHRNGPVFQHCRENGRPENAPRKSTTMCLLAGVEKKELNLTCNGRVLQSRTRTRTGWLVGGIIEAKSSARGQGSN